MGCGSMTLGAYFISLAYIITFTAVRIFEQNLINDRYFKLPFLYSAFFFAASAIVNAWHIARKRNRRLKDIVNAKIFGISFIYGILQSLHFALYMVALNYVDTLSASIFLISGVIFRLIFSVLLRNFTCHDIRSNNGVILDGYSTVLDDSVLLKVESRGNINNNNNNNTVPTITKLHSNKPKTPYVSEYDEFTRKDYKISMIVIAVLLLLTISMTVSTNAYIAVPSIFLLFFSSFWHAIEDIVMKKYLTNYPNYIHTSRVVRFFSALTAIFICFSISVMIESDEWDGTDPHNVATFPIGDLAITFTCWFFRVYFFTLMEEITFKESRNLKGFNVYKTLDAFALMLLASVYFGFFKSTYDWLNVFGLLSTLVLFLVFGLLDGRKNKVISVNGLSPDEILRKTNPGLLDSPTNSDNSDDSSDDDDNNNNKSKSSLSAVAVNQNLVQKIKSNIIDAKKSMNDNNNDKKNDNNTSTATNNNNNNDKSNTFNSNYKRIEIEPEMDFTGDNGEGNKDGVSIGDYNKTLVL